MTLEQALAALTFKDEQLGELARQNEALDRTVEELHLLAKLVRGLSIGFSATESARIEPGYGLRFLKWQWLELSAVTIPANADCSITAIKSADQAIRRAAIGARPVVRLDAAGKAGNQSPGDSGHDQTRRKGVVYLNS